MSQAKLPTSCPSCGHLLGVRALECPACQTVVQGDFDLAPLNRLSPEEQEFVLEFIKASGSLKELAKQYGVSYPTVRNRLDSLIEHMEDIHCQKKQEREETGNGNDDRQQ